MLDVETLDAKSLDSDTPEEIAGSLEPEDFSLILAFTQFCCGRAIGRQRLCSDLRSSCD